MLSITHHVKALWSIWNYFWADIHPLHNLIVIFCSLFSYWVLFNAAFCCILMLNIVIKNPQMAFYPILFCSLSCLVKSWEKNKFAVMWLNTSTEYITWNYSFIIVINTCAFLWWDWNHCVRPIQSSLFKIVYTLITGM